MTRTKPHRPRLPHEQRKTTVPWGYVHDAHKQTRQYSRRRVNQTLDAARRGWFHDDPDDVLLEY